MLAPGLGPLGFRDIGFELEVVVGLAVATED